VDSVLQALSPIVSRDNPMRLLAQAPAHMRFPRLLHALHLAARSDTVALSIMDRHGRHITVPVGVSTGATSEWVRKPADAPNELPLFVRNRQGNYYWFEFFPETRTLYFQYNAVADMKREPIDSFAPRMFAFIARHDVDKLVVDLRWNGGGNMFLNKPLFEEIMRSRLNRAGHLFVIAGRYTFSAAMIFAEQLERYTNAVFIGEPTGSSPNFIGETNLLRLPYNGVEVSLSNLYWQNAPATDRRVWIAPRILVEPTFESWKRGEDPALAAAVRYR
jgi:hypothetical protein